MKSRKPTVHFREKPAALVKKVKMKSGRAFKSDKAARRFRQLLGANPAERIQWEQWESARLAHGSGALTP